MTKLVSITDMPKDMKIHLLRELGYDSDGIFVLKDMLFVKDKYTKEPVKLDNMFIYPGIILDNNQLSITSFFEEYGDVF